jgi:hypothetical protein
MLGSRVPDDQEFNPRVKQFSPSFAGIMNKLIEARVNREGSITRMLI